jgi:hypothetical protein
MNARLATPQASTGKQMQSSEQVSDGKPEQPGKNSGWQRFRSLRAVWKLSVLEAAFWVIAIAVAAIATVLRN